MEVKNTFKKNNLINNNRFNVFTICTENYKDVLDFSIPSWLKLNSIEKIFIYSDFNYNYPNDRVVVINKINKTNDWLEIVGLKPYILKEFYNLNDQENFAFIDVDCYIVKDISEVFNYDFDIAATRMFENKIKANSGVWFCKMSKNIKKFADNWIKLQNNNKINKIGVTKHKQSYGQIGFSDILHNEYNKKTYLKVKPLPKEKYNSESDNIDQWIKQIKKDNPSVLHFKGRKWRDKNLVNKIFKL